MDTLTIKEAELNGFTIDYHCHPHLGIKEQDSLLILVNVYAELETEAISLIESIWRKMSTSDEVKSFLIKHKNYNQPDGDL
jgi:hypothetical protein